MKAKKEIQGGQKLNKILQKLINDTGITERALARALGIPPTTLYQLLSTDNPNPYVKTLLPIAKYFNVSIEQLMGEKSLVKEKIENKTKRLETKEWNASLFIECIDVVTKLLLEKHHKVNAQIALDLIKEAYIFTLNGNHIKVDQNFVEWLVDRSLDLNI